MPKKKTYKDKLLDPKWQKKRLEILNRDGFSCVLCGDKKNTLHVHHAYYTRGKDPWDYPDRCLKTLCHVCHKREHKNGDTAVPHAQEMIDEGWMLPGELVYLIEAYFKVDKVKELTDKFRHEGLSKINKEYREGSE